MRNRAFLLPIGAVLVAGATWVAAQDSGVQAIIGNVFLQNTTPGSAQVGHATITGTFRAGQVFVQQGSSVTIPVVGNSTASGDVETFGGSFSAAAKQGQGVRGTVTNPIGSGAGVIGTTRGNGVGVRGISDRSDATSGAGVQGEGNSAAVPGVRGLHFGGTGVLGQSQTGTGVVAVTSSLNGVALVAFNSGAGTGDQKGAEFSTNKGIGGYGLALSQTGITVGLLGETKSATGFGLFSRGDIGATGTKSFVIDHPLDPENHYLRHFCAEGPEPRNVYVGRIVTGRDGTATVRLPDYFAEINRAPEYTLTVIDEGPDFVFAKVSKEIQGNSFQIRTSKPGTKVSWRVDAVRNDRIVQRDRFESEPLKPSALKGTYLAPELYGKPESRAQWKPSSPSQILSGKP